MFKCFYVSCHLFKVKHIVLVNAHCLKLPVWGIFERLCFSSWHRVMNHGKERGSLEQNWEEHTPSLLPVLSPPVQTEVDANSELHRLEEKPWHCRRKRRKNDLFLFYITTGNGRFLSQTFEASWSDDASPAANHEYKNHSDRQKKYVTFKNQKRNTPL